MKCVTYGVRELQANLGEALRCAQRGEQVLVTSRKKVVAVISRPDRRLRGESAVDRKLRRLAVEGKLRLGRPGSIRPYRLPRIGGLTDQLLEDRR